ncbi:MAG: uracil phosphoribosyltransferase [Desulfurococcales archaeon]|jgi:uracil phosphoribosyltransferase|nr:uracil phosphoribosyltransferase [Desulfurococcales archaeon]
MDIWSDKRVKFVTHPLAKAILTNLRDRNTKQIEFRRGLVRLGIFLAYKIVEDFPVETTSVETPLGVKAIGVRIPDMDKVVIVQVLRASMPLVEGMIKIIPGARQGVVSARRVEELGMSADKWFNIEIKYVKFPKINSDDNLIIADPMFATGSTAISVMSELLKRGAKPKRVILANVISTELAIKRFLEAYPEASVYTIDVDPELNDRGYIVPGLGDAGDRAFGE